MTTASVSRIEIDLNGQAKVTVLCVGRGAMSGTQFMINVPIQDGNIDDIRRRACTALAIDLQKLLESLADQMQ